MLSLGVVVLKVPLQGVWVMEVMSHVLVRFLIIVLISSLMAVNEIFICDRILENSSKSHMKSSVFLHVFNDISTYVYVFTEYFLHSFSNLSIEFLVVL